MDIRKVMPASCRVLGAAALTAAAIQAGSTVPAGATERVAAAVQTQTPIKHVIVIIGENRSFDHVFATYVPKPVHGRPQQIQNLLSQGIVGLDANKNAIPGWNFHSAVQNQATDK